MAAEHHRGLEAPDASEGHDRRERRRQETIDEILSIAIDVMAEESVNGLSLSEVARRLGVKPPSLYKSQGWDSSAAVQGHEDADWIGTDQDMGGIDMCPEAGEEAVAAAAGLVDRWQVVRSFTLEVDDPEQDSVSLGETLMAGDVEEISDLFDVLEEGFLTCVEVPPPDDEVHIEARELALPELGDDRFGFLLSLGDEEDRWDIRAVLVRSGGTLLALGENEILSGDPALTDKDLAAIAAAATDKLS